MLTLGGDGICLLFYLHLGYLLKKLYFCFLCKEPVFPQPLSPKEEAKYIQLMQEGDEEARNKLIEHNLRLVAHLVKNLKIPAKTWKI